MRFTSYSLLSIRATNCATRADMFDRLLSLFSSHQYIDLLPSHYHETWQQAYHRYLSCVRTPAHNRPPSENSLTSGSVISRTVLEQGYYLNPSGHVPSDRSKPFKSRRSFLNLGILFIPVFVLIDIPVLIKSSSMAFVRVWVDPCSLLIFCHSLHITIR